jgi:hypothetical protein
VDLLMFWAASFVLCSMVAAFGFGVRILIGTWIDYRHARRFGGHS